MSRTINLALNLVLASPASRRRLLEIRKSVAVGDISDSTIELAFGKAKELLSINSFIFCYCSPGQKFKVEFLKDDMQLRFGSPEPLTLITNQFMFAASFYAVRLTNESEDLVSLRYIYS